MDGALGSGLGWRKLAGYRAGPDGLAGELERELVPDDGDEPDVIQGQRLVGDGHDGHAQASRDEPERGDAARLLHDGRAEAGRAGLATGLTIRWDCPRAIGPRR